MLQVLVMVNWLRANERQPAMRFLANVRAQLVERFYPASIEWRSSVLKKSLTVREVIIDMILTLRRQEPLSPSSCGDERNLERSMMNIGAMIAVLTFAFAIAAPPCAAAQSGGGVAENSGADNNGPAREAAVASHMRALEDSALHDLDAVVEDFERNRFAESFMTTTDASERRALLAEIRDAAMRAGGALVDESDGQTVLTLEGAKSYEVAFRVDAAAPYRITSLTISEKRRAPGMTLTPATVDEKLTALAAQGFSGAILLKIDGDVVLQKAYGDADPATGRKNANDTIFGIGSRPIDFTVAAINLLAQRGVVSLNDPISKYFSDVPKDKRSMTLDHLMTGRSGLPDFHGIDADWDQDLAWIDRETAVSRILAQPLLFKPGASERHSHSAFGLLASIVETESGESYYSFIRKNFFDPAGMTRTGEYGETRGLNVDDFAVGGGPSIVGAPNIPPNWGPTSWLVKGSGGMYSTLGDLARFYDFLGREKILDPEYLAVFTERSVQLDGSDRGFELFSSYDEERADEVFLVVNMMSPNPMFQDLWKALDAMIVEN